MSTDANAADLDKRTLEAIRDELEKPAPNIAQALILIELMLISMSFDRMADARKQRISTAPRNDG